jgi:hypothetical protein
MHPLVERLMEESELEKGKLSEQSILFTDDYNEFKITSASENEEENVKAWGEIILKVSKQLGYKDKRLVKLATSCVEGEITTLTDLHLQLERRVNHSIYIILLAIIIFGLALMAINHFCV